VTKGTQKRIRSIYYVELDKVGGSIPYDLRYIGIVRRELVLLALLFDRVYLPPKCIIEHPVTLPALESLAELVQSGRIGTSIDPCGGSLHDLMRFILKRMLTGIPKNPFPNTHAEYLRKRSRELLSRLDGLLPVEPLHMRNIGEQALRFSGSILKYMEEAADRSAVAVFGTFLQEAKRSFDVSKGVRWQWVVALGRLVNVFPRQETDTILTTLNAAYFRQGEEANDCLWFPGRFAKRLMYCDLPDYIIPSTARSDLSFEKILRSARRLGVELETALDLSGPQLMELSCLSEMREFADRFLTTILEHNDSQGSELIVTLVKTQRPGELMDVRKWLDGPDPIHRRQYGIGVDLAASDLSLPLRWSKVMRVISLGGLAEDSRKEGDIAYHPEARSLGCTGGEKILSRGMARFLEFFLLNPHTNLTLREVDEYLMEWVYIDTEQRLDGELIPDDEESLNMRAYKIKERLNFEMEPFSLKIEITAGRWTLCGLERIRIVRSRDERIRPENPIKGYPKLRTLFETLAENYPGYVSKEAIEKALDYGEDEQKKVWGMVKELKRYLRKHSSEWTIYSDRVGNYRLDKVR